MNDQAILAELNAIVRDVLMNDDVVVDEGTAIRDVPGWDSFKTIEVALAVESHWGFSIPSRTLDRLERVGQLVDIVREERTARA